MGLYINKSKTTSTYVRNNNDYYNNQNIDSTGSYINSGINTIFGLLTMGFDGKGGDDDGDDGKISKETQSKIDEINKKITDRLNEVNASSLSDLGSQISKSQEQQQTISSDITNTKQDIKVSQATVSNLTSQIDSLKGQLSGADESKKAFIESSINSLEGEKKKVEQQIINDNKKLEELQKKLVEEEKKCTNLQSVYADVENYQHQIDKLNKKELPKEVTYDVNKETEDLSKFSDALKKFNSKTKPTQEDAAELYSAYRSNVDNKTAKKAFELVEKRHPELFQKVRIAEKL